MLKCLLDITVQLPGFNYTVFCSANRATEKDIKEMESVIGSLQEEQANCKTQNHHQ